MPLCHFDFYNLWILKPTHLNRGRGIHVFRDMETCHKLIKQYCQGKELDSFTAKKIPSNIDLPTIVSEGDDEPIKKAKVKFNTFIIQKYIEKPLLIHRRKFDIRVWVLLTQDQDVYFFPEGYLRTSGQDYTIDLKNIDDAFVHLTNNAV